MTASTSSHARSPAKPTRLFTFRSGGWVVLLSLLISVYAVYWIVSQRRQLAGDGVHPETYGFDLESAIVPRHLIVGSGMPKDALPVLRNPKTYDRAELATANQGYGRFLVGTDLVIGVTIGGEARAYPLGLMVQHEVVNDIVGGVPLVVTYSPFCDAVVVMRREVRGGGGRVLEFGHSGLLYNSDLLLYDRQSEPQYESLWSQLGYRAIAGPAAAEGGKDGAGTELVVLPCAVVPWAVWETEHGDTRVMAPAAVYKQEYSYAAYLANDELKYPVEPRWEGGGLARKTRVVAVQGGGRGGAWRVFVLPRLKGMTEVERAAALHMEGVKLVYRPECETLEAQGAQRVVYCFLFGWYAQHPGEMELVR